LLLRAEDELNTLCRQWLGLVEADRAAVTMLSDGMKAWMRGNLDWSSRSERYL
jgi:hypothetical protein